MEREEGVVVRGQVEIDMRQPFRSVKEAVMLFGERVLAGEIYANKLKEMQIKAANDQNGEEYQPRAGAVVSELEQTKQSLEKAKQQGQFMTYCLTSLKQDLEQTKQELQQLKARKSNKQLITHDVDPENEEVKFIENATRVEAVKTENGDVSMLEYQRKRSVKFASSPLLDKVLMVSRDVVVTSPNNSLKKKANRKPPLMALFSGMFSKKKGNQDAESIREPPKAF